ncbi:AAA domain-containing protein [Flavitalea sp.]|nr:AAA domain-containing protein [Flavitalea sp.]
MKDIVFLKALRDKLKGGNIRSIHLNAIPGRFATRLDLAHLNTVHSNAANSFLNSLLTKSSFEFSINFDGIDLNKASQDEQKKLGLLAKRLNSLHFENEDYFKEHGSKTFGFGYPLLIKRSRKDINKVIKAPLFIWPLEIIKSVNKVDTWSILRNKVRNESGKVVDEEIHSVGVNEVLSSFFQTDEGITIPQINEELLEDAVITREELLNACYTVLASLNSVSENTRQHLDEHFDTILQQIPDPGHFENITSGNNPWIHFGGVFGLFRAQKESIISDIDRLIERFDEFRFEELEVEGFTGTALSSVETDPSQQQILNTLGSDPKKIIQGPPGTGKSQSLTALITNALSNGLKCLVVCEKKTALDVIKNNLHKENEKLGDLAAIIEDISSDRDVIVNSVRDRIGSLNTNVPPTDIRYESIRKEIEKSITELNQQHKKLDRKIFAGKTWPEITGEYLGKSAKSNPDLLRGKLNQKDFSFDEEGKELNNYLNKLTTAARLFRPVKTLNHPLNFFSVPVFKGDNIRAAQMEAEDNSETLKTSLEATLVAAQNYYKQFEHWKLEVASQYHPVVHELSGSYINTINESSLFDAAQLPEKFPLEIEILKAIDYLDGLKTLAANKKNAYSQWLISHYETYYSRLKTTSSAYLQYAGDNRKKYGELFFKNTAATRFQISAFGIFLGRYKTLKINRQRLLTDFEEVKEVHADFPYFIHEYVSFEKDMYLGKFVENVEELQAVMESWYKQNNGTVDLFLKSFSSSTLHPEYEHEAIHLRGLEEEVINFIKKLNLQKLTEISITQSLTINDLVGSLDKVIDDLHAILENMRQFRLDHRAIVNLKSDVENKHEQTLKFLEKTDLLAQVVIKPLSVSSLEDYSQQLLKELRICLTHIDEFRLFFEWKQFYHGLSPHEEKVVRAMIETATDNWQAIFESWYYYWVLAKHEIYFKDVPQNNTLIADLFRLKFELKDNQVKSIIRAWSSRQTDAVREWQMNNLNPVSLYNKRGARGVRRNSLRKIIRTDFSFFTSFFPVVMVSPSVCSSIVPLEEGLFDLVIFDEASQLRLEDTFPSLIRGKYKIISGDSQQMPPSSYFQGGGALISPDEEPEEFIEPVFTGTPGKVSNSSLDLADSESLLVYAENSNYRQSFLKVHYRSQHPDLIEFSNHAFYGKRLIPMPPKSAYTPIEFIDVKGVYEEQVNKEEARRVVDILLHHIKPLPNERMPSVGVATFNLYQRNLILEEIIKARQSNPEYDKKIIELGPGLFVKNLENIQGDERDIMIISTTFGRRPDGSFRQQFGPIVQGNGYKLLNVIITRAKYKIFVVSSIPAENINQWSTLLSEQRNNGRAVFYAYLAYARAVNDSNHEIKKTILDLLYANCDSKVPDTTQQNPGSLSPFEEEVYHRLAGRIGENRIEQQYRIGGFHIDMIIRSKMSGEPMIAIECDGAKYHSSNEAYAWDMFRQKQIEDYGIKFYRIWSTDWWLSSEKELDKLAEFIHQHDNPVRTVNGKDDPSL